MKTLHLTIGEGRYKIDLIASLTGRGIHILLTGGESPHIGGVTLSVPRVKPDGYGVDSWVMPVPGHKEVLVAQPLGERICKFTGEVTVVSAGIHIEKAQKAELDLITANCTAIAEEFERVWQKN